MPNIIVYLVKNDRKNNCALDLFNITLPIIEKFNEIRDIYRKDKIKEDFKLYHKMEIVVLNIIQCLSIVELSIHQLDLIISSICSIKEFPIFNHDDLQSHLIVLFNKTNPQLVLKYYSDNKFTFLRYDQKLCIE